ncbi:MAG: hypothetical protein JXK07_06360 [Spirochaetes bacterium]|nr:hypothetical protein [Spirochaetota bacterium]
MDSTKLASAIKKLPEHSSIQIYKYHKPDKDSYYITLTCNIDYHNAIPGSIFDNVSSNPIRKQIAVVHQRTRNAYSLLEPFLNDLNLCSMDYLTSDLPGILLEFKKIGNAIHAVPIKTNMSYLKIGSRYATVASINNIATIPEICTILNDYTYLERIVTIIPSRQRQTDLQLLISGNSNLIACLSKSSHYKRNIDTDEYGRVVYTDVTFFLSSDSISSLNDTFSRFNSAMSDNHIALYCHTNTTRSTYISFFPGNDCYGERCSIIFEQSIENILKSSL